MKHELYELQQMQMLPLQAKINITIQRVQEWYSYWTSKGESIYLSFSGGKDSSVLDHIIQENLPYLDIPRVHVDTGLEYPELREFVLKKKNVVIIRPSKPFWLVVRDYGYPVISKEVSECIENARKFLKANTERERERENTIRTALQKVMWTWRVCLKGFKNYGVS